MSLKKKLLAIFLCIGLIPTLFIAISSSFLFKNALEEEVYGQLNTVREIKKAQIEGYFEDRHADLDVLANTVKELLDFTSKQTLIDSAHNFDSYFNNLIEQYGYYDFFLIDTQGLIFYSAFKELDYQSNLLTGQYKNSNLADLFKNVSASNSFGMVDFSPYEPSNNDPAGFMAIPIKTPIGSIVIALQFSIDKINAVMQQREGMGLTEESYLVGSDFLMRSDSYLAPKSHSVKGSFAGTVDNNGVNTTSVKYALNGKEGAHSIIDYNGNMVLSAFTPFEVNGIKWALIAEIDESEAFAPLGDYYWKILIEVAFTLVIIIIVASWATNSILKPLGGEPNEMRSISESIANGDLTIGFEKEGKPNSVYSAMHQMTNSLLKIMKNIVSDSNRLSSISEKTSALSLQSSESLNQQQSSIELVASAVEEMSASINEVAHNASETANSAQNAHESSMQASNKLTETLNQLSVLDSEISNASHVIEVLGENSSNIGAVLEVIRGIADQTNLLALNAAIEAARAGEQGRGFAVVADEVRSLASKTQESTANIDNMINSLQSASKEAIEAISKSRNVCQKTVENAHETENMISTMNAEVDNISQMTMLIASAVEEQSSVSKEISQSITVIYSTAADNLVNANGVAETSEEISHIAGTLNKLTLQFKV